MMILMYVLFALPAVWGMRIMRRGEWNEAYTSREQTKALLGLAALGIALHHMAQKTCAPWHPVRYTVHGLDIFLSAGYLLVGVFLFCSGLGLYRSLKSKSDYLKGFCRRRILPIVLAFYLSEFCYTGIRLLMGERMTFLKVVWYLSGLHMANFNAWYVIVIPFFYLAFWAAFRFCRREGAAIAWVFAFTFAYTLLGTLIDHQNDWWMRGEWWYNSILLFPLGLLFGRYEHSVTECVKKHWWTALALCLAGFWGLFTLSERITPSIWGYYRVWSDPLRVPSRWLSASVQWMSAFSFTAFWFVLRLKVKISNRVSAWLGSITLEFYLVHGIFVELFGFDFLDLAPSLVYIRSVPLYVAAVLGCSTAAALLFRAAWQALVRLTLGKNALPPGHAPSGPLLPWLRRQWKQLRLALEKRPFIRILILLGAVLLALAVVFSQLSGHDPGTVVMNGLQFRMPQGFSREYSSSRYMVWKYTGEGQKPGNLILDADIRDDKARNYSTVEDVLAECTWLADTEIYINPQGVRMVRGFADYSGSPERRYYIESGGSVLLMCMLENEQFYSRADCEAALLEAADSVCFAK